ncbi:MAG: hypothetical protein LBS53_14625 [Synergistaceae bacterium]|jgi:hypothetical protein|nr:hypothetical protein [Synergistaceae bacterium]
MGNGKLYLIKIFTVFFACGFGILFTSEVFAEIPVKVDAVGFFSHAPMRGTREAIVDACAKFGGQVALTFYDETKSEGQDFMRDKGLSGHIPMRLYVNGKNTFTLEGREVSFSDFVGRKWRAEDLERVIALIIEGVDASTAERPDESQNYSARLIGAAALIIVLSAICLIWSKKSKKKNKGEA